MIPSEIDVAVPNEESILEEISKEKPSKVEEMVHKFIEASYREALDANLNVTPPLDLKGEEVNSRQ